MTAQHSAAQPSTRQRTSTPNLGRTQLNQKHNTIPKRNKPEKPRLKKRNRARSYTEINNATRNTPTLCVCFVPNPLGNPSGT